MSSSAGVSIRWYPNRRYTATIDSSTWSRTATSAGSRSRIPRAGLLSIFMAPSPSTRAQAMVRAPPPGSDFFIPNERWCQPPTHARAPPAPGLRPGTPAPRTSPRASARHAPPAPAGGQAARADPAQNAVHHRPHHGPDDQPGALGQRPQMLMGAEVHRDARGSRQDDGGVSRRRDHHRQQDPADHQRRDHPATVTAAAEPGNPEPTPQAKAPRLGCNDAELAHPAARSSRA